MNRELWYKNSFLILNTTDKLCSGILGLCFALAINNKH